MRLNLEELRSCFELLLTELERRGVSEVDSGDSDLYWTILADDWLNFQEEPTPAVGSLDDDLSELSSILREPSRISFCDFERLAAVLRLAAKVSDVTTSD